MASSLGDTRQCLNPRCRKELLQSDTPGRTRLYCNDACRMAYNRHNAAIAMPAEINIEYVGKMIAYTQALEEMIFNLAAMATVAYQTRKQMGELLNPAPMFPIDGSNTAAYANHCRVMLCLVARISPALYESYVEDFMQKTGGGGRPGRALGPLPGRAPGTKIFKASSRRKCTECECLCRQAVCTCDQDEPCVGCGCYTDEDE